MESATRHYRLVSYPAALQPPLIRHADFPGVTFHHFEAAKCRRQECFDASGRIAAFHPCNAVAVLVVLLGVTFAHWHSFHTRACPLEIHKA